MQECRYSGDLLMIYDQEHFHPISSNSSLNITPKHGSSKNLNLSLEIRKSKEIRPSQSLTKVTRVRFGNGLSDIQMCPSVSMEKVMV